MTFDERVEKLAGIIADREGYPDITGPFRGTARDLLVRVFPDIYGEKPTAWVAPWEASEAMSWAGLSVNEEMPADHLAANPGLWLKPEFAAMRDAYLKRT